MAARNTKKHTKKWFARQLGLAVTNERLAAIWDQLDEDENLPRYDDDEDGWDFALHEARRLLAYEEKRGMRVRRLREPNKPITPTLEEPEGRRANAMMLHWAKKAACEQEVRRFRKRVLNHRLLTLQEAHQFLKSPMLSVFSQGEIEKAGVSIIEHVAKWKRKNVEMVENGFYWHLVIEVGSPAIEMLYDRITTGPIEHLSYPGIDDWKTSAEVWPQSVMHDLLAASESIGERYGWEKGQAPLFILTDVVPLTHALTYVIRHDALGRQSITMTIEPWVTKKTVLRAYHQAQQKIYSSVPGPIGEQNAAIFEFIIERMDANGDIPSIRTLMDAWNRHQARNDWKYEDARLFERDYNRAKASLLRPQLRERPPKSFEEMTPAEQIVEGLRRHESGLHPLSHLLP